MPHRDDKAAWSRPRPAPDLSPGEAARFLAPYRPRLDVIAVEPLQGGLSNFNYVLRLRGEAEAVALRIYDRQPEACGKEAGLHRLLGGSVPVPEILHAEPDGVEGSAPFAVLRHVEGVTFRELKQSGDEAGIREASASAGRTLAAIARHTFSRPGRLLRGLVVGDAYVEGPDPVPRFAERCLESPRLLERTDPALVDRLRTFVWSRARRLATLDAESRLVHGDFNSPNLLVRRAAGRWEVAAVLDWEFAFSGSTLFDVGNFLRYERGSRPLREPSFSRAFLEAGGELPDDWPDLARAIDLTSLCEILTRAPLPDDVVDDVVGLLRSAVEGRDPP